MTKKYPRLLRRKHTFYLRIAIPRDIQHLALRKEFLYSLNTTDYLLAIKLYHIESVAMDKFITLLRVFAMRVSKRAYPILVEFDETDIDNILIHRLEEIIKFCEDNYYNIKRSLNSFNEISIFRPNSRKSMSVLGGEYLILKHILTDITDINFQGFGFLLLLYIQVAVPMKFAN